MTARRAWSIFKAMDTSFSYSASLAVFEDPLTVTGIVFDLRRYSVQDGPGIRTTVFLKGCPLRCAWCHNPESQAFKPQLLLRPNRCIGCGACVTTCPTQAIVDPLNTDRERCQSCGSCVAACYAEGRQISGQKMVVREVVAAVERDRVFYEQSGGGVTFSGGEPLAQPQFLGALLRACKSRGLHTTLDTSGFATWAVLDELRENVDFFLYDLKGMDDERHRRYTGVSNRLILENLRRLVEHGHPILVRIPVVPGVNDDEENLCRSGEFLASLPTPPPVELLAYHEIAAAKYAGLGMTPPMAGIRPPGAEELEKIAGRLGEFGLQVKW